MLLFVLPLLIPFVLLLPLLLLVAVLLLLALELLLTLMAVVVVVVTHVPVLLVLFVVVVLLLLLPQLLLLLPCYRLELTKSAACFRYLRCASYGCGAGLCLWHLAAASCLRHGVGLRTEACTRGSHGRHFHEERNGGRVAAACMVAGVQRFVF